MLSRAKAEFVFVYRGAFAGWDPKADVGDFNGSGMGLFHPRGQDSWPGLN